MTSGEESTTSNQKKDKQKAKARVKANPKVHLFRKREKEKVEEVKERITQKERTIILVGKTE